MASTAELAAEERGRDHGLVRAMGVFAFAAAITNEVVGSGIYRLPASMASAAGTAAPYAYIACLVAMGAVVLCFSEAGSRISTSGGPYGYVEAAFGKMPGFVAGVLLWLSAVLAAGGVAAALADTAGSAFGIFAQPGMRELLIIGVLGVMAGINIVGVDLAAKVLGWATVIKVLPLLLFLIVGGIGLAMGYRAETPITHAPDANFGRAAILAMFALTGMETPLAASGEVRDPARTVPRALILAMASIGLLYIAIQLIAGALFGAGLMNSSAPLADALGTIDPRWRAPLLVGASFSMLIWLGSDFLGAPRVLFAFARDGMLPAFLGRVHPKWRTPHWGIIVHFLLAVGLALTGTFEKLAILSTLAIAPLYFLACASAVVLKRRGIATLGKPLSLPGVPFIAAFGMLCTVGLVALAQWSEIIALAGVLVGSCLLYLAMRFVRDSAKAV